MKLLSRFAALLLAGLAVPATAATLEVSVEIPQISVAEYHRPFVALWLEGADRKVVAQVAVWYQQDKPGGGEGKQSGAKWLPDLRQWWRRGGRDLQMPVDGVSGATRVVGQQLLSQQLPELAAGDYQLLIEAVREEGGRELLSLPIHWPDDAGRALTAQGSSELGAVQLKLIR